MKLDHYQNLDVNVSTMLIEERTKPVVVVQVNRVLEVEGSIHETMIMGVQLSPAEARTLSAALLEGSESSEHTAHLMIALREQKVPEDTITEVIDSMRSKRGRW